MASKGYFVTTDISGYTEYLTRSELDHANEILQSLFQAQLEHIKFPLHVSGFRGDAILMYVPEKDFVSAQSLVEALENQYIAFSETLQQMRLNTSCTCRACKNMNVLDLKMCIHFGDYLLQQLGDHQELLGADVIILHRMLKNSVIEKTGVKAYALFSETAAKELALETLTSGLIPHSESYEHIGTVEMRIQNLGIIWQNYQAQRRHIVDPAATSMKVELEIPFPPSLIWDYLTIPALEGPTLGLEYVKREDDQGGRVGPGATFHCAHSSGDFFNKVVDWKPFDYYTVLQFGVAGLEYYRTISLKFDGQVTHLSVHFSKPEKEAPPGFFEYLEGAARAGYERLTPILEAAIASGEISVE